MMDGSFVSRGNHSAIIAYNVQSSGHRNLRTERLYHSPSRLRSGDLISREFVGPSDDVDISLIFVYSGKINLKQIHT